MKMSGAYKFDAPRERVWEALLDPAVVSDCIPGVQKLSIVSPDNYAIEVAVKVGMFSGSFSGTMAISEKDAPASYKMVVQGAGPMTNVTGEAVISLTAEDEATTLAFEGDVRVSGALARVGQRFMSSAAKSQFDRFFGCLRAKVG